jgi:hypothetical protein
MKESMAKRYHAHGLTAEITKRELPEGTSWVVELIDDDSGQTVGMRGFSTEELAHSYACDCVNLEALD